jgi:uncharacterized delta-60 repeat protein
MRVFSWLRPLAARFNRTRLRRRPQRLAFLCLEGLEDRLTPSGGGLPDPTFGSGGIAINNVSTGGYPADMVLQPDGKILTAGYTTSPNTSDDFAVARYNSNGTLDATFGGGGLATVDFQRGSDSARAVALQPGTGGKVLVAGYVGGDFGVVRLNPSGAVDTTFGPKGSKGKVIVDLGGAEHLNDVAVLPSGKFVLAGASNGTIALARFNADGTLDTTFGNKGKVVTAVAVALEVSNLEHAVSVAVDTLGRVVVSGNTRQVHPDSPRDFLVARFTAAGALDTTFGAAHTGVVTTDIRSGSIDRATALVLQGDGKIVLAGYSAPATAPYQPQPAALVRYNPDGSLDPAFGQGGVATAAWQPGGVYFQETSAALEQPDGKILLAGLADDYTKTVLGSSDTPAVLLLHMRLNPDGSPDTSYGSLGTGAVATAIPPDLNARATAMALQPDGRVILAGFQEGSGVDDVVLARYLPASTSPSPVQVGSLAAAPNPVAAGSSVTLTAGSVTTTSPGATIAMVAFYVVDAVGSEQFLGYGARQADGTWALTVTADLAPGTYTLLALAVDSTGVISDPVGIYLDVT